MSFEFRKTLFRSKINKELNNLYAAVYVELFTEHVFTKSNFQLLDVREENCASQPLKIELPSLNPNNNLLFLFIHHLYSVQFLMPVKTLDVVQSNYLLRI